MRRVMILALAASVAEAQSYPAVPSRTMGTAAATSVMTFQSIAEVRGTARGLLVHDPLARRVVLLGQRLELVRVLYDSTHGMGNAYGRFLGRLIRYRGDSSMFVEQESQSLSVLDVEGRVARSIAIAHISDISVLVTGLRPGIDDSNRLVYSAMPSRMRGGGAAGIAGEGNTFRLDSLLLLRVDLGARRTDTLARIARRGWRTVAQLDGTWPAVTVKDVNPLAPYDDWAMLSDGTVAVIRGMTYHAEFIRPDGTRFIAPKVPFEWQAVTDSDRAALIAALDERQRQRLEREAAARRNDPGSSPTSAGAAGRASRRAQAGELDVPGVRYEFVSSEELPAYRLPFIQGATLADGDGNLWVRVLAPGVTADTPVYDVLNVTGKRIDRVRLSRGERLVGFGPRVAYVALEDATGMRLKRFSLPR